MKVLDVNSRQKLFELKKFGTVYRVGTISANGNSFISAILTALNYKPDIKEKYRVMDTIRSNFIYYLIFNGTLERTYGGAYEFLGSKGVKVYGDKFDLDSLLENSLGYSQMSDLLFEPLADVFNINFHVYTYDQTADEIYEDFSGGHNDKLNVVMLYHPKYKTYELMEFRIKGQNNKTLDKKQYNNFLKEMDMLERTHV